MIEYSESNRFPFHTGNKSVTICTDNHDEMYELDFIFNMVVERFPALDPKPFYAGIEGMQNMPEKEKMKFLKEATDRLLCSIKLCLMDEEFVHQLHDRWGFGIDKLI